MKTFQTKHQQVYEALRAAIISGEIAPGDCINIRQVARQFEVSDIPVREALKALAGENLVQIVPYAGAVAAPISGKDVAEMGEIRLVLEPWATRLATAQLLQGDLRQLADDLDEMDRAVASGDMASSPMPTAHSMASSSCGVPMSGWAHCRAASGWSRSGTSLACASCPITPPDRRRNTGRCFSPWSAATNRRPRRQPAVIAWVCWNA